MNKWQIDRLGERLRDGATSEADLRSLDEYRLSFGPAYAHVIGVIRATLSSEPTGRPSKSTRSIVEKLRRETIRLSQIQDIAGARLVLPSIDHQDQTVQLLLSALPGAKTIDRRDRPSHGYRAVHIVPVVAGMPVEIQVRTIIQHRWAELSEKLSDSLGPDLKYGGGDAVVLDTLLQTSALTAEVESRELELVRLRDRVVMAEAQEKSPDARRRLGSQAQQELDDIRRRAQVDSAALSVVFEKMLNRIRTLRDPT